MAKGPRWRNRSSDWEQYVRANQRFADAVIEEIGTQSAVVLVQDYQMALVPGMLGADLIGFHLQQHCNNFLDSVDRMVEARLDWDRFAAEFRGHSALVRPFPISVQPWSELRGLPPDCSLRPVRSGSRWHHGV